MFRIQLCRGLALTLFFSGLFSFTTKAADHVSASDLALQGSRMTSTQSAQLEAQVKDHPDDLTARTKLLGHYFEIYLRNANAKEARAQHILWIINNKPESEIAGLPQARIDALLDSEHYDEGKEAWQKQVKQNGTDTAVLSHAADFFLLHDRNLAESCWRKAEDLEPRNPRWPDQLAQLYSMSAKFKPENAAKAFQQKEEAYDLIPNPEQKFYMLGDLAQFAFNAGKPDKASEYANLLLTTAAKFKDNWNYGNAIHRGHTILGLLALQVKDKNNKKEFKESRKVAKQHLIASATIRGSAQLESFGPSLDLAKALLADGEKDSVVAYLKLCRRFWDSGKKSLDAWVKDIQTNGTTTFEPVNESNPK